MSWHVIWNLNLPLSPLRGGVRMVLLVGTCAAAVTTACAAPQDIFSGGTPQSSQGNNFGEPRTSGEVAERLTEREFFNDDTGNVVSEEQAPVLQESEQVYADPVAETVPSGGQPGNSQPFWFGYSSPVLVGIHGGESYADPGSFVSLDLLKPLRNWRFASGSEQIVYFDGRIALDLDGGAAGNIGIGRRHYSASTNSIWGAGMWYDVDGTRDRLFHQVSGGLEWQREIVSLRGHYYFPIGETSKYVGHTDLTGNTAYVGNTLALERFRIAQQAYEGFDVDFGLRFRTQRYTELRVGYFGFHSEDGAEITGVSALGTVEAAPGFYLSVNGNHDTNSSDSTVMFSATYDFSSRRRLTNGNIRHRLGDPVRRNRHIVSRGTYAYDPETALNADGTPINVIHVSSSGNSTGAAESPYANFAQATADATATPNSIILVHADSVFDGQSVVLPSDTRLLGETIDHTVATSQLGDLILPRATTGTALPVFLNSSGFAAITLADNSEVNGFRIKSAAGSGIRGDGLTGGTTVLNTTIDGAVTGIQLANGTGATQFTNSTILNTTGVGLHLLSNAGTVGFNTTSINTTGGDGVFVENNASTVTLESLLVSSTTGSGLSVRDSVAGSSVVLENSTTVSGTGSHGVLLESNQQTSSFISNGTLSISNAGAHGIAMIGNENSTTATFNDATVISTTVGDGVHVANLGTTTSSADDVQFLSSLALDGVGQSGVVASNNSSNIRINTLAITDWDQSAIALTGGDGRLTVTDPLVLNNINGSLASTILISNVESGMSFGDVTIFDTARTATGAPTVNLIENHTNVESISFDTLNVTSVNGTALFATQSGTNFTKLEIGGGSLNSVGQTALSLNGTSTAVTLRSVSAANTAIGINLNRVGPVTAFHEYLRITGDGATPGSGGSISGVQRGVVISGSEDISLNYLDVDASVTGVELASVAFDQPENASIVGLRLTDSGGTNDWIGIDVDWGQGAHFDDPTTLRGNSIIGTGTGQTGIHVVNSQSNPGMDLTISGNDISVSGANSDGINLAAIGILPAQTTSIGDINLTGPSNNTVFATQNPFISSSSNGAEITGQILINGALVP